MGLWHAMMRCFAFLRTMLSPSRDLPAFRLNELPDELLIQVLREVPVECRVSLRTVSRKWHNIILDLGYHIEPKFVDSIFSYPYYPSDIDLKPDPALRHFAKYSHYHRGEIDEKEVFKLLMKRREFITSPPISTITAYWTDKEDFEYHAVKMMVRTTTPLWRRGEGIRIGDLLDIREALKVSCTGDLSLALFDFRCATTGYNPLKTSTGFKVVQQAVGKAGIEIRRSLNTL